MLNDIYILRVRPEGSSMGNYKDIKLEAVEDKIIKITKIEFYQVYLHNNLR